MTAIPATARTLRPAHPANRAHGANPANPASTAAAGALAAPARATRLRITRRGRAVLAALAAAPLVVGAFGFALNGGGAVATSSGSAAEFEYVTVASGESLWSVAESIAPGHDPRVVIDEIVRLNALPSADVLAGERLAIPAHYTD